MELAPNLFNSNGYSVELTVDACFGNHVIEDLSVIKIWSIPVKRGRDGCDMIELEWATQVAQPLDLLHNLKTICAASFNGKIAVWSTHGGIR